MTRQSLAVRLSLGLLAAGILAPLGVLATSQTASGPRFEVSFTAGVHGGPVTGRIYVAMSRSNDRQSPIQQASPTGAPLFGVAIEGLSPGQTAVVDGSAFGHPLRTLRDLPAGDYWVQPFVNVYTRFPRADGHTVWLHMDQWEGQNWKSSPGNIFGDPVKVTIGPGAVAPIRLVADKLIPAIALPADTPQVKRIRIQSEILTKWWGQPIYLGATILLPKGYEANPAQKYPIVYHQGHFSLGAPGGYGRDQAFTKYWDGDGTPRMLYVTIQHPSPYYDDSYGVNSENNGPFGDAITKELMPAVETQFRAIREPWARILTGGSTGGWIALAHQIFYPDLYGGTFSLCPDGVDFRYHQIVNIYQDPNAYWIERDWMKIERPNQRRPDGNIQSMMKDENWYELVVGDKSRSGGQWDIWEATYSPVGADGYPRRLWDKQTGVIDKTVAEAWKKYDLRETLEKNWTVLGPKLAHKLNVYIGDMDSYFLNMGVRLLDEFLKQRAKDPPFSGEIVFQPMAPHCWGPRGQDLHENMAAFIVKHAPPGADTSNWRR
ncbi:MAG TPA: alpha/beta hydrolase-fold protein [Vicinamibacterales bacterium]|nr:alpha/beta hydrolase-fold protein [Vicinamibacterales bacterium]